LESNASPAGSLQRFARARTVRAFTLTEPDSAVAIVCSSRIGGQNGSCWFVVVVGDSHPHPAAHVGGGLASLKWKARRIAGPSIFSASPRDMQSQEALVPRHERMFAVRDAGNRSPQRQSSLHS
jgi:hypothetical protein